MTPRNLATVIDAMLAVIPETATVLRGSLNAKLESARCTAPEVMWWRWQQVAELLEWQLGRAGSRDAAPWHADARRIFVGPGDGGTT